MTKEIKKNEGFVILFAVTLSAILLSIALGVANIAFREVQFGTSAKDTNDAFFAADTGAECALVNDKTADSVFTKDSSATTISCHGNSNIPLVYSVSGDLYTWKFTITGMGSSVKACAAVTMEKIIDSEDNVLSIKLVSKGHNNNDGTSACNPGKNIVERELELSY